MKSSVRGGGYWANRRPMSNSRVGEGDGGEQVGIDREGGDEEEC